MTKVSFDIDNLKSDVGIMLIPISKALKLSVRVTMGISVEK